MTHHRERRCPSCAAPHRAGGRFCERCGTHLDVPLGHDADTHATDRSDAEVEGRAAPPSQPPASAAGASVTVPDAARTTLDRRSLLVGVGALAVGTVLGGVLLGPRRADPILGDDGLPTAELELGDARELADRIDADGPLVLPEGGARLAVVRWDPSYTADRRSAMERYGPDGVGHPVLDETTGLLCLSLVSTHLGCQVPFCSSSGLFEDPCHGARWNAWGEWVGGPAPRGLDGFASRVRDDGTFVVDMTAHVPGVARDAGVLAQEQYGPSCVDG